MSMALKIYEQAFGIPNSKGQLQNILTHIATIFNSETIEELQGMGRKNWYLDSECGAEFELQGYDLNSVKDLIEDVKTINGDFDDEDWYRCSLSY